MPDVELIEGRANTVTVDERLVVQLLVFVTATVSTVLLVIVGVMLLVVAPLLQEYVYVPAGFGTTVKVSL